MIKFGRVLRKIKEAIVQDCPTEYYACEVCNDLDCTNEKWLKCQTRLEAAEFMGIYEKVPIIDFVCEYQKSKSSESADVELESESA